MFTASLSDNEVTAYTVIKKNKQLMLIFFDYGIRRHSSKAGTVNVIVFLCPFVDFVTFSELLASGWWNRSRINEMGKKANFLIF